VILPFNTSRALLPALLLLAVVLTPVTAQSSPDVPSATTPMLTIEQCIQEALANGPDNRILQAGLEASRAQLAAAVSQNSLNLQASLSYGGSKTFGEDPSLWTSQLSSAALASVGASPGTQAGLSLSGPLTTVTVDVLPPVPLPISGEIPTSAVGIGLTQRLWSGYPGGTARAGVDKLRLSLQIKELSTQAARLNLVYQIKQAYFTVLAAQRSIAVQQEILQKQNDLLQQIEALSRMQQASAADLLTAQANARGAQADLDNSGHTLRLARIRLANLLGRAPEQDFSVAEIDAPQAPTQPLQQSVADGLARRTDISQIELNRKSLAIDVALAKAQNQPSLGASGGLGVAFDTTGKSGWNGNYGWLGGAGLRVTLPVLDSGAAKNLIDSYRLQDQVYATQEDQARSSIAADIQDAYEALQIQLQRVEVAKLNADALRLQFRVVQTETQYGTATYQDLQTAAVNDSNAQTALVQARINAQLAALKLQNVMGY
jgi:outer membrane protein